MYVSGGVCCRCLKGFFSQTSCYVIQMLKMMGDAGDALSQMSLSDFHAHGPLHPPLILKCKTDLTFVCICGVVSFPSKTIMVFFGEIVRILLRSVFPIKLIQGKKNTPRTIAKSERCRTPMKACAATQMGRILRSDAMVHGPGSFAEGTNRHTLLRLLFKGKGKRVIKRRLSHYPGLGVGLCDVLPSCCEKWDVCGFKK